MDDVEKMDALLKAAHSSSPSGANFSRSFLFSLNQTYVEEEEEEIYFVSTTTMHMT